MLSPGCKQIAVFSLFLSFPPPCVCVEFFALCSWKGVFANSCKLKYRWRLWATVYCFLDSSVRCTTYIGVCVCLSFIYLFICGSQRENLERDLLSTLFRWLQRPALAHAETRSQELQHVWKGPRYLDCLVLLSQAIALKDRQLYWKRSSQNSSWHTYRVRGRSVTHHATPPSPSVDFFFNVFMLLTYKSSFIEASFISNLLCVEVMQQKRLTIPRAKRSRWVKGLVAAVELRPFPSAAVPPAWPSYQVHLFWSLNC